MRIIHLAFLLLAIPFVASEAKKFSLGDIIRITVQVDDPADLHTKLNSLTFGTLRQSFSYDEKAKNLSLVTKIPFYNRIASPAMELELVDPAQNIARITSGAKTFEMPEIEAMKIDRTAPKLKNIKLSKEMNNKLKVSYDVDDESLAFSTVMVACDVTARESRRFGVEISQCKGDSPSFSCIAEVELPEKLPGTPVVGITVVDMGNNRTYLSSKDREGKDLELKWASREVKEADYEPIAVSVKDVKQDAAKNEVNIAFTVRGGDGLKRVSASGKVVKNGEGRETQVFALEKATASCEKGECKVTYALPIKLQSRNFQLEIQVTGNNERVDRVAIEKTLIDVSKIALDTTPPKLKSVTFEVSNATDLDTFEKNNKGHVVINDP